jgi:hypothetical protein
MTKSAIVEECKDSSGQVLPRCGWDAIWECDPKSRYKYKSASLIGALEAALWKPRKL